MSIEYHSGSNYQAIRFVNIAYNIPLTSQMYHIGYDDDVVYIELGWFKKLFLNCFSWNPFFCLLLQKV